MEETSTSGSTNSAGVYSAESSSDDVEDVDVDPTASSRIIRWSGRWALVQVNRSGSGARSTCSTDAMTSSDESDDDGSDSSSSPNNDAASDSPAADDDSDSGCPRRNLGDNEDDKSAEAIVNEDGEEEVVVNSSGDVDNNNRPASEIIAWRGRWCLIRVNRTSTSSTDIITTTNDDADTTDLSDRRQRPRGHEAAGFEKEAEEDGVHERANRPKRKRAKPDYYRPPPPSTTVTRMSNNTRNSS